MFILIKLSNDNIKGKLTKTTKKSIYYCLKIPRIKAILILSVCIHTQFNLTYLFVRSIDIY